MVSARPSLVPFLLLSVAFHSFLLVFWPNPTQTQKGTKQIPVTFFPIPQEEMSTSLNKAEEPSSRPIKTPVQVAKKSTILSDLGKQQPVELTDRKDKNTESDRDKESLERKSIVVNRPLPTLDELLPPVTWSSSKAEANATKGPVRLGTREPKYILYFDSIKRDIELVWEYPEPALAHGLQGKLILEFTVSGNGHVEKIRLIRSSGFSVLDNEAIRAIKSASPFHPIPPWIMRSRLEIIASFEYSDNRLKYGSVP